MTRNFYYNAPKIELHLHLEGSLSDCFWKRHDLQVHNAILKFKQNSNKSLGVFLECMELIHRSLNTAESYYHAMCDLLDQLILENVKYVEITWAPGGIFEFHGVEPKNVFNAIKQAIADRKDLIDAKILVDIIRNQTLDIAQTILDWLANEKPAEVVGINFGGDEERFRVDPFLKIFQQAKALNLKISIHAGESVDESLMVDAIRKVKPNRIGHGTALKSKSIKQEIIECGIHIEACPSSNLCLGYLTSLDEHHGLVDDTLSVSINTDDRTFFSASITDEICSLENEGITNLKKIAHMQCEATKHAFSTTSPFLAQVQNFWRQYV